MSEKEQFVGVLKEYKRLLYKVIYLYCRDSDDRKDLEQEIIIQLWKSFKNYNQEFKMSTWIYKIALHVAISYYRKDLKRKESNEPYNETVFEIAADDDYTEQSMHERELLYKFINKLNDLNKAIIILHLDDKSYKEISEIIGLTETNVGTKINRIKMKLKESISLLND
jgi:RNA polymerase sigma factor (sigma-70 family)